MACLFKRLINELPGMIGGFLGDLFGLLSSGGSIDIGLGIPTKAVNLPQCFLENFIGTTIGNMRVSLQMLVNVAFDAVTGIVGEVAGIHLVMCIGFIDSIIAFLQCLKNPKCPTVKEWSIQVLVLDNGGSFDIDSISSRAESVTGSVTQLGKVT